MDLSDDPEGYEKHMEWRLEQLKTCHFERQPVDLSLPGQRFLKHMKSLFLAVELLHLRIPDPNVGMNPGVGARSFVQALTNNPHFREAAGFPKLNHLPTDFLGNVKAGNGLYSLAGELCQTLIDVEYSLTEPPEIPTGSDLLHRSWSLLSEWLYPSMLYGTYLYLDETWPPWMGDDAWNNTWLIFEGGGQNLYIIRTTDPDWTR